MGMPCSSGDEKTGKCVWAKCRDYENNIVRGKVEAFFFLSLDMLKIILLQALQYNPAKTFRLHGHIFKFSCNCFAVFYFLNFQAWFSIRLSSEFLFCGLFLSIFRVE